MPGASLQLNYSVTIQPPTPVGTGTVQRYTVPGALNCIAETNAIAEIHLIQDDYVLGSSTSPVVSINLEYGSPYIDINVTNGGGGESCTSEVITGVDGVDPDLSKVRALVIKAFRDDDADPGKLQALFSMGNLGAPGMDNVVLPIAFDSAAAGITADAEAHAVLAVPTGIAYSGSYPINLTIYEALNCRLVILIQGK